MREFNRNDLGRPKRRSFNDWIADLQALSGKRDVSQDDLTDAQIQAAFAADPKYSQENQMPIDDMSMAQIQSAMCGVNMANEYAAAECADGRAREQRKDEINE